MSYHLLLTYDISSNRLRARVHKFLKNYGQNIQKSVFEVLVDSLDKEKVVKTLWDMMIDSETDDSIRIYQLCRSCERKVSYLGYGLKITNLEWTIV